MNWKPFKSYKHTDIEYVQGVAQKNPQAEQRLYYHCKEYFENTYKKFFTVFNIEEDLFHDAYVKLWTEISTQKIQLIDNRICRTQMDGTAQPMKCNLNTYLMAIAINEHREWVRKDRFAYFDDIEIISTMRLKDDSPTPMDVFKEQIVSECVLNLPQRCKEILTLFYYEGKSLDEILEIRKETNTSKDGLKTSKHKCMTTLKGKVREQFDKFNLKPYTHERGNIR